MMDQEFMRSLIEHKYEGACFHCYASTYFKKVGLPGYAALHKSRGKDEYEIYIDLIEVYVDNFGDMPMINKAEPSATRFQIDENADFATKMEQGLEVYEDYEKSVLDFYKQNKRQMENNQDPFMSNLMKDAKNELKFIEELDDEMESNHYNPDYLMKLDKWLIKKYDKNGNKVHHAYAAAQPGQYNNMYSRSNGSRMYGYDEYARGGSSGGNYNRNHSNYGYDNYANRNYNNYGNNGGRFGMMI